MKNSNTPEETSTGTTWLDLLRIGKIGKVDAFTVKRIFHSKPGGYLTGLELLDPSSVTPETQEVLTKLFNEGVYFTGIASADTKSFIFK